MDIKAKIEELVNKAKNDEKFRTDFMNDPVKTIEGVLGVDLPEDQINQVIDGIKAKITVDSIKDKLGAIGGIFGAK